jgi:hypothetical protein
MNAAPQTLADLRAHQTLCRELLALAERESQFLRQDQSGPLQEVYQLRRLLLPHLNESLEKIRRHRLHWQSLTPAERSGQPEVQFLIRQVQDLIMRVILLDRENEQGLLRRGLIPPRDLAMARQARPHFVADLYRRRVGESQI